jgi:hypothetical protein
MTGFPAAITKKGIKHIYFMAFCTRKLWVDSCPNLRESRNAMTQQELIDRLNKVRKEWSVEFGKSAEIEFDAWDLIYHALVDAPGLVDKCVSWIQYNQFRDFRRRWNLPYAVGKTKLN